MSRGNSTLEAISALTFIDKTLTVGGHLTAQTLEGDGAKIHNISFEGVEGFLPLDKLKLNSSLAVDGDSLAVRIKPHAGLRSDDEGVSLDTNSIRVSRNASSSDFVVLHQTNTQDHLTRMPVTNFFSLIGPQNGVLFDFINDGKNSGDGLKLLKNKTIRPRECILHFRTLKVGEGLIGTENDSHVSINLAPQRTLEDLTVTENFIAPHKDLESIENPVNGMVIYNIADDRLYTYAKSRWIGLHRG
jgi:hypothetical protein